MKSSSLSSSSLVHIIRNSHSQFLRRSISSVIRQKQYLIRPRSVVFPVREMASNQQCQSREELDAKARQGETVVPGGTGGKSLEAQEHLAEGRSRGGQTRKEQLGKEGYQEMGRKGGLSTSEESGEERAQREGIPIEESKLRTKR